MNMISLHSPRQVQLIVSSVSKVMKTGNIQNLSKAAYNYLYLCSGFIAHFNHAGFKSTYSNVEKLRHHILQNKANNQWNNFRAGEKDYEYYMQKKSIYNELCKVCQNV